MMGRRERTRSSSPGVSANLGRWRKSRGYSGPATGVKVSDVSLPRVGASNSRPSTNPTLARRGWRSPRRRVVTPPARRDVPSRCRPSHIGDPRGRAAGGGATRFVLPGRRSGHRGCALRPVHHPQGWPQRWPGRARQRCDRRDRQRRPAARRPLRAGDRRLREGAVALVRGLGADRVIDRDTADFTKDDHHFDVVFDAVGKSSFRRCRPVLKPRSLYLTTARPACRRRLTRCSTVSARRSSGGGTGHLARAAEVVQPAKDVVVPAVGEPKLKEVRSPPLSSCGHRLVASVVACCTSASRRSAGSPRRPSERRRRGSAVTAR